MEQKTFLDFKNEAAFQILCSWWNDLRDLKGEQAALRRAKSLHEIFFCSAYHRLRSSLKQGSFFFCDLRLALVVGVAAHIREDGPSLPALPVQAASSPTSAPLVSALRFRSLVRLSEPEEFFRPLLRVLRLLGNEANLRLLSSDLLSWNPKTQERWLFAYYEKVLE